MPRKAAVKSSTVEAPKVKVPHAKPENLIRVKAGEYAIEKGDAVFTIEQREGGQWYAFSVNDETSERVELEPQSSRHLAYELVMAL